MRRVWSARSERFCSTCTTLARRCEREARANLRPFDERVWPLHHEAEQPQSTLFGVADEDVPSVALETETGDVIVFTETVFHSAYYSKIGSNPPDVRGNSP